MHAQHAINRKWRTLFSSSDNKSKRPVSPCPRRFIVSVRGGERLRGRVGERERIDCKPPSGPSVAHCHLAAFRESRLETPSPCASIVSTWRPENTVQENGGENGIFLFFLHRISTICCQSTEKYQSIPCQSDSLKLLGNYRGKRFFFFLLLLIFAIDFFL